MAGPVIPTVDHADIRGLGTTLHVPSSAYPHTRHEDLRPLKDTEGCAFTAAAPLLRSPDFSQRLSFTDYVTGSCTCCVIAHSMGHTVSKRCGSTGAYEGECSSTMLEGLERVRFPTVPPRVAFFDRKGGFLFSERWLF